MSYKRIAIIRTDRIGEVILTTPLAAVLKQQYPDSNITFFTSDLAYEVLQFAPQIDTTEIFDTIQKPTFKSFLKFLDQLRHSGYDLAVVANPHKYSHLAVSLAGIKTRVGFNRKWGKYLLTHSINDTRAEGKIHELDANLKLLQCLGISAERNRPSLVVSAAEKNALKSKLSGQGINFKWPIISFHPGSSFIYKRWPREYFKELIKKIQGEYNVEICLNGDVSEKYLCKEIAINPILPLHSLAGTLTVRELVIFLSLSQLVIANDSGPMHIADALGTNLIAIFGRGKEGTGPNRWGPTGKNSYIFHKIPQQCTVCVNEACAYNFECLKMITPEEVFNGIKATQLIPVEFKKPQAKE
ncbi:MAG: glycosyltransferase family 9 protein [Candidatus Omnitrophica bacterium]|nr:glycosyltransferase family 9 protein [Candidatus Omnitrophota bacterium]